MPRPTTLWWFIGPKYRLSKLRGSWEMRKTSPEPSAPQPCQIGSARPRPSVHRANAATRPLMRMLRPKRQTRSPVTAMTGLSRCAGRGRYLLRMAKAAIPEGRRTNARCPRSGGWCTMPYNPTGTLGDTFHTSSGAGEAMVGATSNANPPSAEVSARAINASGLRRIDGGTARTKPSAQRGGRRPGRRVCETEGQCLASACFPECAS